MRNIVILLFISFQFPFIGCNSSSRLSKTNRQLLKEYAYCKCFQYATGDTTFFIQDVSISVYFDIANYNFRAYYKVDSLSRVAVEEFKPFVIADYQNKKAVFFKCFDFYKSKRLALLVKSMDKEANRHW